MKDLEVKQEAGLTPWLTQIFWLFVSRIDFPTNLPTSGCLTTSIGSKGGGHLIDGIIHFISGWVKSFESIELIDWQKGPLRAGWGS